MDENESDMLTKPMTRQRMIKLATKVGLGGEQPRRQKSLKTFETWACSVQVQRQRLDGRVDTSATHHDSP